MGGLCSKYDPDVGNRRYSRASIQLRRPVDASSSYVRILKPHGSLDWFECGGNPVLSGVPLPLERLVIAPTRDKFEEGYKDIYSYHRDRARAVIASAARLLVIGYSFGDHHLHESLVKRMRGATPTVVLTRSVSVALQAIAEGCPNTTIISKESEINSRVQRGSRISTDVEGAIWHIDALMNEALA